PTHPITSARNSSPPTPHNSSEQQWNRVGPDITQHCTATTPSLSNKCVWWAVVPFGLAAVDKSLTKRKGQSTAKS
ncbi:unnamed protein product, partial [Ectocarpus sp. 4 AP-2014]